MFIWDWTVGSNSIYIWHSSWGWTSNKALKNDYKHIKHRAKRNFTVHVSYSTETHTIGKVCNLRCCMVGSTVSHGPWHKEASTSLRLLDWGQASLCMADLGFCSCRQNELDMHNKNRFRQKDLWTDRSVWKCRLVRDKISGRNDHRLIRFTNNKVLKEEIE